MNNESREVNKRIKLDEAYARCLQESFSVRRKLRGKPSVPTTSKSKRSLSFEKKVVVKKRDRSTWNRTWAYRCCFGNGKLCQNNNLTANVTFTYISESYDKATIRSSKSIKMKKKRVISNIVRGIQLDRCGFGTNPKKKSKDFVQNIPVRL